ncbi:hypothetical protein SESBI_46437 [Sesbania bispinosa]|nr:hypothetical protein SESBI_46437 [Sesbania bispinosa]
MLDVTLLQSFDPISCSVLIEKEGDTEALKPFIAAMSSKRDGFVPQMDAKAMKAFRNEKREQVSQSSGPVIVIDAEHEVSSSTVSDKLFQGFEGKEGHEITSIFDRRHPTGKLIKEHFSKSDDLVRIQKVGMPQAARMAQDFAVQEKEKLSTEVADLKKDKEELVSELADVKKDEEKSDNLMSKTAKLLKVAEENLLIEQQKRQDEANQLKAEISYQYEQGFEKVVGQVKFLHPDIQIDEVGAFKEIQDGKLVDLPDEE